MRQLYNYGYELKITKTNDKKGERKVRRIIEKYTKIVVYHRNHFDNNEELVYVLRLHDSHKFGPMFEELELKSSALSVNNISLSLANSIGKLD